MRKILISMFAGAALLVPASAATADTPRVDRYYTVVCVDPANPDVTLEAESIDAHAIEQGGKKHAIELFSANYPFHLDCTWEGPFPA
jgi:hypothetical protein